MDEGQRFPLDIRFCLQYQPHDLEVLNHVAIADAFKAAWCYNHMVDALLDGALGQDAEPLFINCSRGTCRLPALGPRRSAAAQSAVAIPVSVQPLTPSPPRKQSKVRSQGAADSDIGEGSPDGL